MWKAGRVSPALTETYIASSYGNIVPTEVNKKPKSRHGASSRGMTLEV